MKRLVIAGAGTAGTIVANRMVRHLPADWELCVIDPEPEHHYQPGLLYLPFGARDEAKNVRSRARTLRRGVQWIERAIEAVEPDARTVRLVDADPVHYDLLVLASGSRIRPDETPGLIGPGWRERTHEFYTLEGARALRERLAAFEGGRLLVNIVELPIKCPVAPLEFLFLADDYFQRRKLRERVELVFVTPLDGAFTRPVASRVLGSMLGEKGIEVVTDFSTGEVDGEAGVLRSYDGREQPFDLLVTIPTHMGAEFVESSGLGNELAFVPTDRHTLRAREHEGIFVLGDATDLPSSKAGSVAHFQAEVLAENLLRAMAGRSLLDGFDGHANCFIESGHGKALLIDFNYDVEPLPGRFPLPGVGPFKLLEPSRTNHLGKRAFRWLYWHRLLPGKSMGVAPRLSMRGKRQVEVQVA